MNIELFDSTGISPTVIKVVGVGGGGNNAVNRMIAMGLKNVSFVAINTDQQALHSSNAETRFAIGTQAHRAVSGRGGIPEIGEKAALEDQESVSEPPEGRRHGLHHRGHGRRHGHGRGARGGARGAPDGRAHRRRGDEAVRLRGQAQDAARRGRHRAAARRKWTPSSPFPTSTC